MSATESENRLPWKLLGAWCSTGNCLCGHPPKNTRHSYSGVACGGGRRAPAPLRFGKKKKKKSVISIGMLLLMLVSYRWYNVHVQKLVAKKRAREKEETYEGMGSSTHSYHSPYHTKYKYKAKRKMAYDGTDPAARTNRPSKKHKTRQTTMKSMFASINPAPAAAASAGTTTSLIRSSIAPQQKPRPGITLTYQMPIDLCYVRKDESL